MLIDLKAISTEELDISETLDKDWWQASVEDAPVLGLATPLRVRVKASKVRDKYLLAGRISGAVFLKCDRCLEAFRSDLEIPFSVFLVSPKSQQGEAEVELLEEDLEVDFIHGETIDLDATITNPMTPLSWMLAFGGGVAEANGYRFLTPENIATMKFLKAMQESGCAWVATTDKAARDILASRKALFITASLEELPDVARAFSPADNSDRWTVLTFPGPEREALVVYGSSFIVLKSDAHQQLASWLFIRWMLSAGNPARWVKSTVLFPLRASTLSLLADYSASHPQWAAAVNLLSRGEITPQLASWRVVRVMLGDGFNQAFRVDTPSGSIAIMLAEMDRIASDLNK